MLKPGFVLKICGITNEEDARDAVAAGANALGFNFYAKSPRYITRERAHAIASAVEGDYLRVGVFVNPSQREVEEAAGAVPLDVVQLHGDASPAAFSKPLRIWRAAAPTSNDGDPSVEAWLLDAPSNEFGGSGQTFDWKLAREHGGRVILAGGLDASNVAEAIETARPWGVDACSRLEAAPGKKSREAVEAFLHAAELALATSLL